MRNLDEYSCATTAEINGIQHSNTNSTSSAFEMNTNSTSNVLFSSEFANIKEYAEEKNNNVTNKKFNCFNAKLKNRNSSIAYDELSTKFFDASNSNSKGFNLKFYSKFKQNPSEMSRQYSSSRNSVQHQKQVFYI